MKKFLCLVAFLALSLSPLHALLAPLNQSIKEINEVLSSYDVTNKFPPGETIIEIKRENDSFWVKSEKHQMKVEVIYQTSTSKAGPRQYKLRFGPLKDR